MKPRITRNVIWNLAGTLAHLLAGFVVMPFLIRHLGQTGYGLWTLVASMTSYFAVLDLGTSGSVARNLAFYRSRNDSDGVNAILNSALAILGGAAAIAIVATFGVLTVFFSLFEVPADQVAAVQWSVFLVGTNLALSFPLSVSGGILWAYERFDLQNMIDIPVVVLRTALTLYLIGQGYGLIALAIITFSASLLQNLAKWSLAFSIEPRLRLGLGLVQRDAVRVLFDYGAWFFLLSLARTITPQIPLTLIGHRLSVAKVAVFRIPTQLVAYADGFLISATQVLTPMATSLHANRKATEQQQLFLEGGKFSLLLAFYVLVSFSWLGEPFIRRWLGSEYASTWGLLMILALGEFLPMSQWVSYSMILGMGKHKPLAWMSLLENLAVVTLLLLLGPADLAGVCVAIAVPAMLCRGLYRLLYACRLVQVSLGRYLRHTFVPTLGVIIPGAAMVSLTTSLYPPDSWPRLIAVGAAYSVVFWGVAAIGVLGWERCKEVVTW